MGRRQRRSQRQWEEIIGAQERSGLSARAYCKAESIGTASFYQWRRRAVAVAPCITSGKMMG